MSLSHKWARLIGPTAFAVFAADACTSDSVALAGVPMVGFEWEFPGVKVAMVARDKANNPVDPELAGPERVLCASDKINSYPLVSITYDDGKGPEGKKPVRTLEIMTAPFEVVKMNEIMPQSFAAIKGFFAAALNEKSEKSDGWYKSWSSIAEESELLLLNTSANNWPCGRKPEELVDTYGDHVGYVRFNADISFYPMRQWHHRDVGTQTNVGIKLSDLVTRDLSGRRLFGDEKVIGQKAYEQAKDALRNVDMDDEAKSFLILVAMGVNVHTEMNQIGSDSLSNAAVKNMFGMYPKTRLNDIYRGLQENDRDKVEGWLVNSNEFNTKFCVQPMDCTKEISNYWEAIRDGMDPIDVAKPAGPITLNDPGGMGVVMEVRLQDALVNRYATLRWRGPKNKGNEGQFELVDWERFKHSIDKLFSVAN
ncbi:hypothetical protein [Polyangium spumosum]|uniref:Uncharacterized protein n=1 Tax=Polyangium spumosum TaxID=889282 RepID=A0A6N7PLU4_9BACT|nr:hypothetical protein [Polyangium spumosum]MRG93043.1 hypothetical protein [Polyangium spumosum]